MHYCIAEEKVKLQHISHADLCKFLSDFTLSSDWPELCVPARQSSEPNLHHLTIKGEEGRTGGREDGRKGSPVS